MRDVWIEDEDLGEMRIVFRPEDYFLFLTLIVRWNSMQLQQMLKIKR